jgi:hypothetical protein
MQRIENRNKIETFENKKRVIEQLSTDTCGTAIFSVNGVMSGGTTNTNDTNASASVNLCTCPLTGNKVKHIQSNPPAAWCSTT